MIFADILPSFLIKRITLTQGKTSIDPTGIVDGVDVVSSQLDISLRNQRSLNWMRIPKLQEYINIYILQVSSTSLKADLRSRLYYPQSRYAELVPIDHDSEDDPISFSLETIFKAHRPFDDNFQYKVLTLAEVVGGNTFGKDTTEGFITRPYDFSTNKDMSFTVNFDLDVGPQDLCYFVFAHLNLKAIKDDYASDNLTNLFTSRRGESVFNRLNRISSNLSYDVAIQNGAIPEFMSAYVIQGTLKPYVGPVRNINGAYAGFRTEVLDNGRTRVKKVRLNKINYRNNKVFMEQATNNENFSWGDAYRELNENDPLPAGNWFRYSYADQFNNFKGSADLSGAIVRKSVETESLLLDQLKKQDPLQGFIEYSLNSAGKQEVLIGFDYFNSLSKNSQFKAILKNIPSDLKNMILQRSRILEVSVARSRVSSRNIGLGALGLDQKKKFELDNQEEVIVISRDAKSSRPNISYERMLKNFGLGTNSRTNVRDIINNFVAPIPRIRPAAYKKQNKVCADIEEVNVQLEDDDNSLDRRYLLINDYSFQEINQGEFRYKLSLDIEDGTEYLLMQFSRELKKSIKDIESFISFVENNKGYDNNLKQYKRSLVLSIRRQYRVSNNIIQSSYIANIDKAIYNFVQIKRLIEPNGRFRRSLAIAVKSLYKFVDPTENSTLEHMNKFLKSMKELEQSLSSLMNKKDNTSFIKKGEKKQFKNTKNVKTISVKKEFYKTSKAVNSSILLDYSGKYEDGIDRDTSSVLQKNLAARQAIRSQANVDTRSTTEGITIRENIKNRSIVFGNITKRSRMNNPLRGLKTESRPDRVKGSGNLVIYPSSILLNNKNTLNSEEYGEVARGVTTDLAQAAVNKIINSSEIKKYNSGQLKLPNLIMATKKDSYSDLSQPNKEYFSTVTIASNHINSDGLTIGTINATDNSKSKVFKDKDETITESFNNLISNNIFEKIKNEDANKNKLEILKENEILSTSLAYEKYLNFLTKASSYTAFTKSRENAAARQKTNTGDIKTDFFVNRAAFVKHRVSFNNTRKENTYSYIKGEITEEPQQENFSESRLKEIRIIKFEPMSETEKESIEIVNRTLFLER